MITYRHYPSLIAAVLALTACETSNDDTADDGDAGKSDCATCPTPAGPKPFTLVDARLTLRAQPQEPGVVTFDMVRQLVDSTFRQYLMTHLELDTSTTDRVAYCLDVIEAPGTILCMTFAQAHMNNALGRAGVYTGQGRGMEKGTLLPIRSPKLANLNKLVDGQNLSGSVLREFFEMMADTGATLLPEERDVARLLASPKLAARGDAFYMIAVAAQSASDNKATLAHEIQHSTYNVDARVHAAVREFWQMTVSSADKTAIREQLGAVYNAENEDVMIDEFQAYLLQQDAEHSMLGAFVPKYQAALLDALARVGYVPPTIE